MSMHPELTRLCGTPASHVVTNIGQLFETLAEGWQPSGPKRLLIAGERGQFIRVPPVHRGHLFHAKQQGDITVETGGYRMAGFIKFEARDLFPGLFATEEADDGEWCLAKLTGEGVAYARAGLIAFDNSHPDIKRSTFFNPPTHAVRVDELLPGPRAIAGSSS